MSDKPTPHEWDTSSDVVVYEFSEVAVRLPPGTPAPPRPGRLTKADIERLRRMSSDSSLQEFTDSAKDETGDSPESRA
jgi:hypothetical protein